MKVWFEFALTVFCALVVTLVFAAMLNITGDCMPEVTDCGEFQRRLSFLVLANGAIGLGYYIFLFLRHRPK